MNNNYLAHYGVKGMKWGVRRDRSSARMSRIRNYTGSRSSDTLKSARRKDINKMSNQELQETINRLNLERNYRSLTQVDINFGQRKVSQVLAYEGTAKNIKRSASYAFGKRLIAKGVLK
nr:MAG TPA: Structural protein [Bacteriophage sp.]